MNYLLQSHFFKGAQAAAIKLGTVAGTITYAPVKDTEHFDPATENRMQREFKGLDEHNNSAEIAKAAAYVRGDFNRLKSHRNQIISSAIEQAFDTNNGIGEELGLGDPAATQPHGSEKAAFANPLAGGSSPVMSAAIKVPGVKSVSSMVPKVEAPKIPGLNLKSSITDMSHSFLDSQSNFSRAARGNGSPF